jgi:predicted AAA+ superfamily ATPase
MDEGRDMATLPTYERPLVSTLLERVGEPRRFMQVVVGPRQSGKTTAISQMLSKVDLPHHMVRASQDIVDSQAWLRREWDQARLLAGKDGHAILVIDEVQMVRQWSSVVKALWDADTDADLDLQVVLTGSSSLLLRKGLTEGLTGRFELISCNQWDYPECRDAFGYTLDDYLFFGGYPGAASLRGDEGRWLGYMTNSVIAPSVTRDVVSLEAVHKPAVMERLFSLGAAYSAQELSYRKILGQLDDAGNTTTIAPLPRAPLERGPSDGAAEVLGEAAEDPGELPEAHGPRHLPHGGELWDVPGLPPHRPRAPRPSRGERGRRLSAEEVLRRGVPGVLVAGGDR